MVVNGVVKVCGQTPIYTDVDLATINNKEELLQGNYILMNDLILEDWTPIGRHDFPFNGIFNGNGYTVTIKSFHTVASTTVSDENGTFNTVSIGLFGTTDKKAIIKNLTVAGNLSYNSEDITLYMGAIVGDNKGEIVNCVSTANIDACGGLYSAKRGWGQLGLSILASGLSNRMGYITYQNESCGGGIVGLNRHLIHNCYATGDVTVRGKGHKTAGGIAGRNGFGDRNKGSIIHCYAMGNIVAKEDNASRTVGGITSMCLPGDVLHCVALNKNLEAVGSRKGMTVGGFGPRTANNAFGVVAFVINDDATKIYNAYYRSDMTVLEAKDEEDEKAAKKGGKKNYLHGNTGNKTSYELTQDINWWNNKKNGVVFPFGTDETQPWVWSNDLKRPILYWQAFENHLDTIPSELHEADPNRFDGTWKGEKKRLMNTFFMQYTIAGNRMVFEGKSKSAGMKTFVAEGSIMYNENTIIFIPEKANIDGKEVKNFSKEKPYIWYYTLTDNELHLEGGRLFGKTLIWENTGNFSKTN